MNKSEIIKTLSVRLSLKKKDAKLLLESFSKEFFDALSSGETISIPDFGTFTVSELKKRRGFNPLIEKWMMLPPKRKLNFKPATALKNQIKN